MEIDGTKRKGPTPITLHWDDIFLTEDGDNRPPEIIITSNKKPKASSELVMKSDRELNETIARFKQSLKTLPDKLRDGGERRRANLKRHEDELERRRKRQLMQKVNNECKETIQVSDDDGVSRGKKQGDRKSLSSPNFTKLFKEKLGTTPLTLDWAKILSTEDRDPHRMKIDGCKRKGPTPVTLDWNHLLPTPTGDDDRPPEIIIISNKKPKEEYQTENLEIVMKTDREIEEAIARFKLNLKRHEDELERRPKRQLLNKVKRVLISLDSESEEEHEKIKLSSIDPPMPSKSIKEWNGKRKRNKKQVSFDDGDEEILKLKGERRELVENVSPISDSVGGKVSSSQCDMICVQGYKVKNINAPILKAIFRSHGDIAAKCVFTNAAVRASLLEAVCEIVGRIKTNDVTNIISKMEEIESEVSAAEASKINVSWLQAHLETIRKRNEAQKKVTLLMEMKTNTILAKRAARTDLKDKYDNLVAANNQFQEAKRCVKVLDLVEKKLSNDVLEFKAEKDLFVGQPILYVD